MADLSAQRARLRERLIIDGTRVDADIMGRVTGATLTRAYDSATNLELICDDHDFALLRSGLLTKKGKSRKETLDEAAWARFGQMRLVLDGVFFRLAGVAGAYNAAGRSMTLTFEDEVASLLRRHKTAKKVSRAQSTRAEFIGTLAAEVQALPISYHSPEQKIKQKIKGDDPRAKRKERQRGLGGGVTVKGVKATKEQRANIETALAVADEEQAGDRAALALLVAGTQESGWVNLPGGDRDSEGVLQVRRQTAVTIHPPTPAVIAPGGLAHGGGGGSVVEGPPAQTTLNPRNVAACARTFLRRGFWGKGGAIAIARKNPDMSPGEIAQQVQGSAFPTAYAQWENEAQGTLSSYGGVGTVTVHRAQYTFRREKNETSWDASRRLADEVRWRRWADENMLWYVSDEWLIQRRPTFTVDGPLDPELRGITFDADVAEPLSEVVIEASVARWVGPPGSVLELDKCGPYNGRWLLAIHELDLLSEDAQMTYRRPAPALPEPTADRSTSLLTETEPEAGSPRARILQAAKAAFRQRAYYQYEQVRPMPDSLSPPTRPAPRTQAPIAQKIRIDCSAFATLCYKQAGVSDPNGRGYDGYGYTGTLWANGAPTTDPQPGDLCFFGAPGSQSSHVNVYAGNGKAYNMGPTAGLSFGDKDVRADFHGFRTYDLGDA